MKHIMLGLMTLVMLVTQASASIYYVSTSGSDTNNCTSTDTPCRTIQLAVNLVKPGDSIQVASGSYGEAVKIMTNGTVTAPISVTSSMPQGASVANFQLTASYWTINGFDISNQTAGDTVPWGDGIYIRGSFNTVENNYIHELCEEGITADYGDTSSTSNQILNNRVWRAEMAGIVAAGTNWIVSGNEISDIQQKPNEAGGIYLVCTNRSGADADYMRFFGMGHVFTNNYMHDINVGSKVNPNPHNDCWETWNYNGNTAGDIIIDSNWCSYPKQWNISSSVNNHIGALEDMSGWFQFSNNIAINAYRGLIIDSSAGGFTFAPIRFWNNTIDNIYSEGVEVDCGGSSCSGPHVSVENNIFSEVGHGSDSYYAGFECPTTIAQNVFHMRSGSVGTYAGSCSSVASMSNNPRFVTAGTFSGTQGSAAVTGTSTCDGFSNRSGISTCADYDLSSSSPDTANGVSLNAVPYDYYGTARPSNPSIGAIQY